MSPGYVLSTIIGFVFCYIPTIYFWGIRTSGSTSYNWVGTEPHTLWFLLILSVNTVSFFMWLLTLIFLARWKFGYFNRTRV